MTKRIKELRLKKNMTLLQVAKALGVSEATAQRYESGEIRNLKYDTIVSLAELFGVNPAHLMGWDSNIEEEIPASGRSIPILGTVCAGDGIIAVQDHAPHYMVDIEVDCDFALRVKGDSMKDAEIYDGDVVFLKSDSPFVNGAIYVIEFADDAFVRYVHKLDDKLLLSPCNPEYEPIIASPDDVKFDGKVVGVYHGR